MSRPLRIEYPGAIYHITSRGNNKAPIFKDDHDRESFLNTVRHVNKRYNWLCHAYCLMDNHYHLIIETPDGNLSQGMRQLNGVYTQLFNKRYGRVGHIFQGRYKAILIQKESHLLEVCRYVVLNPIRARSVNNIEEWKWSSYSATAGKRKPHPCLTTDWVLGQFGNSGSKTEKGYCNFVKGGIGGNSIWGDVKAQSLLGDSKFVDRLLNYLKDHEDIAEIPKSQRFMSRPGLGKIFPDSLMQDKGRRNKKIKEAIEMYGYSQKEVADFLEMHYTSISRVLNEK
ncbi:MAG TPA: addiction module toxin RelE [Deltaproteobacteria bacterium]|nr:addiction module toxin RelE [Deltaproteobacteria bacterium]